MVERAGMVCFITVHVLNYVFKKGEPCSSKERIKVEVLSYFS